MFRKLTIFAITFFAINLFYVFSDCADARRMGGGRSFGSRPSYQQSAPKPAAPQRNSNQPTQNQLSRQTQAPTAGPAGMRSGGWMGMLGGFMMGGLLGSMLFGGMHGFGGPGFLDILIVGGLLFFFVRYLRARRMASGSPFSADLGRMPFQAADPQDTGNASGYGATPQSVSPTIEAPPIPPGFDQEEFLKGAKIMFNRLQRSWDKRDLEDIRQFTGPDVWNEIKRQAEEDPHPGKTEVILVNARLMEAKVMGDETVASVLYDVLMRENPDEAEARQVHEIWHFHRNEKVPGSFWVLEGIQQVED